LSACGLAAAAAAAAAAAGRGAGGQQGGEAHDGAERRVRVLCRRAGDL
jgi:hypothetical protein